MGTRTLPVSDLAVFYRVSGVGTRRRHERIFHDMALRFNASVKRFRVLCGVGIRATGDKRTEGILWLPLIRMAKRIAPLA